MKILIFIAYILLSSTGLVLFKMGTNSNLSIQIFNLSISIKSIIGILCYGCSFLLWLLIVSKSNLTFVVPLSVALVNTLVILESCLFLHEKISINQGIGIFLVLLGVFIMTWKVKQ